MLVDIQRLGNMTLAKMAGRARINHDRSICLCLPEGWSFERQTFKGRGVMSVILAVAFDNVVHIGRALRQVFIHIDNEGGTRTRRNGGVMLALKADGRAGLGVHATPTERACYVRRVDLDAIIELEQALKDALVE